MDKSTISSASVLVCFCAYLLRLFERVDTTEVDTLGRGERGKGNTIAEEPITKSKYIIPISILYLVISHVLVKHWTSNVRTLGNASVMDFVCISIHSQGVL